MRQQLALFLTGVGVLLLLYVSFQYWQMYAAQKKLALAWQQQDARPVNIVGSDGDALVRLTITKINLDAVIVEGTSRESLKLGPGHMEDSALPGSSGNSVIVAHRDTFFRPLRNIRQNDVITVSTVRGEYRYRVVSTRIVSPSDVTVLQPAGTEILTLVTCYPFYYVGSAPDRFIVRAERIA